MKNKLLILLTLMFLTPFVVDAEELKMDWQKNWGGSDVEKIEVALPTEDNGIVVIGQTRSTDINDLTYSGGFYDALIVKFDKNGNLLWEKLWGGNGLDCFYNILQTEDGGFIIVGETNSTDIEDIQNKGSYDAIIVKYDKDGNLLWQKNWGGSDDEEFYDLYFFDDDSFIVMGVSWSDNMEGLPNKGDRDAIIVKYDKDGNMLWQKSWGGDKYDYFHSVISALDGGFIMVGESNSNDIEDIQNKDSYDAIIVKYDKDGNMLWQKSWGGDKHDHFFSVISALDGGFVIVGKTRSNDIEDVQNKGFYDAIIVKYDKDGNLLWQKSWGGSEEDSFNDLYFLDDGSFIAMGISGWSDAIIIKYDKDGNLLWQSSYGNEAYQRINSSIIDRKGNLIVCIESYFIDEGEYYNGDEDVIIISYDKNGNMLWQKNWDGGNADRAKNLFITEDNSLFVLGDMGMSTSSDDNIFILKYSYEYDLENVTTENGMATAVQQGPKGIITPTPNEGYEVDTIIIKDKNGEVLDLEVTKLEDGTYSFDLFTDVSVEVTFKEKIENPKTGILDIIAILFIGAVISICGFILVKRYNERYEI